MIILRQALFAHWDNTLAEDYGSVTPHFHFPDTSTDKRNNICRHGIIEKPTTLTAHMSV